MNIHNSIELHKKSWEEGGKSQPFMIDVDQIIGFEDGRVFAERTVFDVEESYDCIMDKISDVAPAPNHGFEYKQDVYKTAMAFLAERLFKNVAD